MLLVVAGVFTLEYRRAFPVWYVFQYTVEVVVGALDAVAAELVDEVGLLFLQRVLGGELGHPLPAKELDQVDFLLKLLDRMIVYLSLPVAVLRTSTLVPAWLAAETAAPPVQIGVRVRLAALSKLLDKLVFGLTFGRFWL